MSLAPSPPPTTTTTSSESAGAPPPPPSLPTKESLKLAQKNQSLIKSQQEQKESNEIPMETVIREYRGVPLRPPPTHPKSKHQMHLHDRPMSKLPHWYILELLNRVNKYATSPSGGFGGVFFCLEDGEEELDHTQDTPQSNMENPHSNFEMCAPTSTDTADEVSSKKHCLFVIKGTASPAEEIFANHLMRFFSLNCPECFLIEYAPNDNIKKLHKKKKDKPNLWSLIKAKLDDLSEGDPESERIEKALTRAFFLIMEFQDGSLSLADLKMDDAREVFALEKSEKSDKPQPVGSTNTTEEYSPPVDSPTVAPSPHTPRSILRDLGTMIVLDLLLNNWDRLPLRHVMEHEGNAGNIMFKRIYNPIPQDENWVRHELVCIDQAIFAVHQENQGDYIERIEEFFCDLAHNASLKEVVTFVESETGFELSREQELEIIEGIWDCLDQVRDKMSTTAAAREILTNMKDEIGSMKTGEDWEGVFENSIKAINVEFLLRVLDRLREFSREKFLGEEDGDR